jgi:hypothetical protein
MERSTALNKNLKTPAATEGIARVSGRMARFAFFPTGIPSIGSMRRGHHAISLSEPALFDKPGLFEQYFEFR